MPDNPNVSGNSVQQPTGEQHAMDLELWKHFAGSAATDKHTMIIVVSWLLAFTVTAIGYLVTTKELIDADALEVLQPARVMIVALLGLVISIVAGFVAVLYGGYAHRNWAHADAIARKRSWAELVDRSDDVGALSQERGWLAAIAWRVSRPVDHARELAPVFWVYAGLALLAVLAQIILLGLGSGLLTLRWACSVLWTCV